MQEQAVPIFSDNYTSAETSFFDFCPNYTTIEKHIPDHEEELLPGIKWGHYCQLYTPAFWKYMYIIYGPQIESVHHRIGSSIIEEIVGCLLGGYGMPSELCLQAFKRLKCQSLIKPNISFDEILDALSSPFEMEDGSFRKYRFYNQKSQYVFKFLNRDDLSAIPTNNDIDFRNWLLSVDGIGFKTASWVTRNWLHSEKVAILDIHILRAGQIAGLFSITSDVSKRYLDLENTYIEFCSAMAVRPSNMDAIIWNYMKKTNKLALQVLSNS